RNAIDMLISTFQSLQGQVEVSFRYDVVFVNEQADWTGRGTSWAEIDAALAAIPDEFLWDRPPGILRLHRDTGQSVGPGNRITAGETKSINDIWVYDAGAGATPHARSVGIRNMSALEQTLRHEVGHLVEIIHPKLAKELATLMGWEEFSWDWTFTHWQ